MDFDDLKANKEFREVVLESYRPVYEFMRKFLCSEAKGKYWEDEFATLCVERGFEVYPLKAWSKADFFVNGLMVQCKAIDYRKPAGETDSIRLRSTTSNAQHGPCYSENDFDVLALKSRGNIYLVPVDDLPMNHNGQHGKKRVKHCIPVKAVLPFKDNWDYFVTHKREIPQRYLFPMHL